MITNAKLQQARLGFRYLWAVCVMLLMTTQQTWGADAIEDTYRYSAMLDGIDQIRIKFPVYDHRGSSADTWAEGTVYIQVAGGNKETLLKYKGARTGSDNGLPNVEISRGVDGTMVLKRAQNYADVNIYQSTTTCVLPCDPNQSYSLGNVVWSVPRAFRGKRVTMSWAVTEYVQKDNTNQSKSHHTVSIESADIEIPAAPAEMDPMLMQPILAFQAVHAGQIMIPWMIGSDSVVKAQLVYLDRTLERQVTQTLTPATSDMAYVPATHVIDSLYVVVDYKDSERKLIQGRKSSPPIAVPMLHTAKKFTAKLLPNGAAQLDWQIDNIEWEDIMDGDQWEIQRNLTGSVDSNDPNWESLTMEVFERNQEKYQYVDATLAKSYLNSNVSYRIRRLSTADWGWTYSSGQTLTCVLQHMYLPTIESATIGADSNWGVDYRHDVVLNWKMTATGGEVDENTFYLRTEEDWETFAMMVNSGNTSMKAVMLNDITLTELSPMVGNSENNAFSGTFNGNGHTLTVNFKDKKMEYLSPFQYINGVTIRNLHVAGTIDGGQHSAGMAGRGFARSNNLIENCRVSAVINCTWNNPHAGGFIGHNGSASTTLNNCLFDGNIIARVNNGDSYAAPFIGWEDGGTHNVVTNNLEDGKYDNFSHTAPNFHYNKSGGGGTSYGNSSTNYNNYSRHNKFSSLYKGEGLSNEELASKLGSNNWEVVNGKVVPMMPDSGKKNQDIYVWDENAKLNLYIDKYVDGKLRYTEKREINNEERLAGKATIALTTSCVNHGFRMAVERNGSNLQFMELSDTVQTTWANVEIIDVPGAKHIIRTVEDWEAFAMDVAQGKNSASAVLANDLDLGKSQMTIGLGDMRNGKAYMGEFDGMGHTLTVHFDGEYVHGVFLALNNATVKNLHVAGSLKSDISTTVGGIAGEVKGTTTIENCRVSADIACRNDVGAIAANAKYGCNVTIKNCLFDGTLNKGRNYNMPNGGMVGYMYGLTEKDPAVVNFNNCLFAPQEIGTPTIDCYTYAAGYNINKNIDQYARLTNSYYTKPFGEVQGTDASKMTAGQLLEALGSGWMMEDNAVVPKTKATAGFYFDNNVEMDTIYYEEKQTSVVLHWETTGGEADYYRITRHDLTKDTVVILEEQYKQQVYVDEHVRPQHEYDYTVEGITSCEGNHVSAISIVAHCVPTGLVRGYVRLVDGTALAGRTVIATPVAGSGTQGAEAKSTVTDDNGYFEITGLVYSMRGQYTLTVPTKGDEDPFEPITVEFSDETNMALNQIFTQANYFKFAGVVLYDGSSIPVVGAKFLRDGQPVRNANGQDVVTNSQGQFSLSVPKGEHTIQVWKEGHKFLNDGYYLNDNKSANITWKESVYNRILWDQTKVRLQGRVVGGHIQGDKPLGQSLSKNNLGKGVTMVFQLEGDNSSWIVRDQLDNNVKERHETFRHGATDPKTGMKKDMTRMDSYTHRIVVYPDSLTGEYEVPFFPVKYKVTEIYASGYSTLFQSGTVAETLDLTTFGNDSIATYSRVYHSAPRLHYQQMNMMGEEFLGIKQYVAMDIAGTRDTIRLWDQEHGYVMGHPVYMAQNPVIMSFSAREEYYFNNNTDTVPDIVPLGDSKVIMQNGLVSTTEEFTLELDSVGRGTYTFTPDNITAVQTGNKALRSLTMTLLNDSTYYNQKPLQAFVMAAVAKTGGRKAVANGGTYLLDILRDPPGATSSAYIESGSKLNYSFKCDWNAKGGVNLALTNGTGANYYIGAWGGVGAGATSGNIMTSKTTTLGSMAIVATYNNSWNYSYEFSTSERIQTSSATKDIGANADLYIGLTQNAIVEEATAVRVVSSKMYKYLEPREAGKMAIGDHEYNVKRGTVQVLARGYDAVKKDSIYLIRDDVMSMSTELASTFIHSQDYIINELIPDLLRQRAELMLPMGTSVEVAQQIANSTGKTVYISKVSEEDDTYCLTDYKGQPTYTAVYAKKGDEKVITPDEINRINQEILTWAGFIEKNEKEKLEANELVKRYDFDGRANVQYSETFTVSTTESRYLKMPFVDGLSGTIQGFQALTKLISKAVSSSQYREYQDQKGNGYVGVAVDVLGYNLQLQFSIVLGFDYNYAFGKSDSNSKKTGFTLACGNKSSMLVDVYRTKSDFDRLKELSEDELKKKIDNGEIVIFSLLEDEQREAVNEGRWNKANAMTNWLSYYKSSTPEYRNFVYRTRGGITAAPYEDQRVTQFYRPGSILDERTIPIDNLRIWTDNASVSNVPFDEPARFKIYIANETLYPDRASLFFNYFLDTKSNPKGAKVSIDGAVLTGSGYQIKIPAGQTITKEVEIMAGDDFDYEDIGISINDPNDINRISTQKLSAHFVPSAGKVNISLPGDKWVVNTDSEYDADRQDYFLPVQIDGFNVNFRNFDHIELQYKLTTQGDKNWVNVCSYYNDKKLLAQASGVRDTIANDGIIRAIFYGEGTPIEQQYDLRAVVYCRYGNGYLTSSSNILTGIKDTRRPQLFGNPKPNDGVLGIGDDIVLRFSEAIAGNYLRDINNFQVVGQTNSSNIALSTNLRFNGNGEATSEGWRNLTNKSFTVDMMLNPDYTGKAMTVFSHGSAQSSLELGLTADRKLTAAFSDTVFVSNDTISFNKSLHQVQYMFDVNVEENMTKVSFFDGSKNIGTFNYPRTYAGSGNLTLGANKNKNIPNSSNYEGSMLEFRLWNRTLTPGEMSNYSQKVLTGYELGLLDNYPLSEGQGRFSYNRVSSGSDLQVNKQAWKSPDGIGMVLDGKEGFSINSQKFAREAYQDYTMMFWFRTTDEEGTLLSNGEAEKEPDYIHHFNFGVRKGLLNLRLGGREITTNAKVNDGQWHHTAITVSRSRNVGNLYVDDQIKNSFPVDSVGGIGQNIHAGVTYVDADTKTRPIAGHIDEIAMYEMVLPENMIKSFANITPSGEEMGMLAYLNFSHNVIQSDNSQRLMPTGLSMKRYLDPVTGKKTTQRDTLVAQDVIDRLADVVSYAPMRDMSSLENIPFSFVADGKDLLINLDLPDNKIEKTNVMVTVKEVADLNGNLMASPVNMNLYVYRNPLRWKDKRLSIDVNYEEERTFKATITNQSGQARRYTLEGLPVWVTASQTDGVINSLDEETITFTISPYINKGDYDEVICLVGENGMSEPLPINISVRGEKPDWVVNDSTKRKNITMHLIARVEVDGNVAHDPNDLIAVYGPNHKLLGLGSIDVDNSNNANEALAYITVYNDTRDETPLRFQFFDASTGRIYVVNPVLNYISFKAEEIIGSTTDPVILKDAVNNEVQEIKLKQGWNWVSFYVKPQKGTVNELLNDATNWYAGDALEIIDREGTPQLITYMATEKGGMWDNGDMQLQINPRQMYRFFTHFKTTAYMAGEPVFDTITVHGGWNRIGYISALNLPIGTAMADYTDQGTEGDIIKSQSEFAVLTKDASNVPTWKGTLKYLRSGEGYMLHHQGTNRIQFSYPMYTSSSRYSTFTHQAPLFDNHTGSSMNMIATVEGVELSQGDQLVAYMGAEKVGVAEVDEDGRFFLNVSHGSIGQVTFAVEREGDIVAVAPTSVAYIADAVMGTFGEPTVINFIATDDIKGSGWYNIQGIKLNRRPTQSGVYIYNGKPVVIK